MISAPISAAASGDTTLVAGIPGKKIRVVNFVIVATTAVNVKFTSGTNGGGSNANLTGLMTMATGVPIQSGYGAVRGTGGGYDGQFDTANQGDALLLNLSGNVQVSGWLDYIVVP